MVSLTSEYISVGGNRHPAAADWDVQLGVLAFGADNNVALWDPLDPTHRGVYSLLVGHTDKVSAVRFYTSPVTGEKLLLTGSVDRTIRIWRRELPDSRDFIHSITLEGHQGSVNTLAVADGSDIVVSGAADGTVRIWRVTINQEGATSDIVEVMYMKPRYFPLSISLAVLETDRGSKAIMLAVAGTMNNVQIYVSGDMAENLAFTLCATLAGHEAWVRSLAFTIDRQSDAGDVLLASASQDKYIRLWRIHRGERIANLSTEDDEALLNGAEAGLSNKAHEFEAGASKFSITFEALLFGNEDWIYTVAWNPDKLRTQLLSASADNTLTIWEADPITGLWISAERMGEISVQKGSTSATGSTGGFWNGLWSPDGNTVVCLGRTGSWRVWKHDADADLWVQDIGITGHVRSVNGISWEASGGYLLSTSSDQTTRLHAEWARDGIRSWHELSRPQIHGYDLNCIDTLGPSRFVSGADEKLLRVFNEPGPIAQLLETLSDFHPAVEAELPDTAQIPVLGLSNKSMGDEITLAEDESEDLESPEISASRTFVLDVSRPPLEDHLARHTLWPEHEKLYGHGYELSAVAVSHDRSVIATACKASSVDHAVIRLYDAADWHEIKPSLMAHSLTITSLAFSPDDHYLLSVGRDRQWAVFARSSTDPLVYALSSSNPKGHLRMILDAAWAPLAEKPVFATAGRDKSVKIWQLDGDTFVCKSTVATKTPVTAVAFMTQEAAGSLFLAAGEETGEVSIHSVASTTLETRHVTTVDKRISPSKTISELAWRPSQPGLSDKSSDKFELAVASEDSALRVYRISDLVS